MTTKRALIVDDSKTAQHRLKRLLRKYRLDIVAVDSAEAALSYLSSSVPDVVFMDHLMPGMDGFRALQIIKSHPATATIPVIMYTSKSGDVYTSQARALGALDVVSKDSINASDLRDVLKAIHIYPGEGGTGSAAPAKPEPEQTAPSDDGTAEKPLVTLSDKPPVERRQYDRRQSSLSTELKLRDLEHSIDDSRRIITSRLVREVQGVRHEVRNALNELAELKSRVGAEPEPRDEPLPPPPEPPRRLWPTALTLVLAGVVSLELWQVNQRMDRLAAQQAESTEQLSRQLSSVDQPSVASTAPVPPAMSSPGERNRAEQYLPDLSWALNQSSVQAFHRDIVSPELERRMSELLARLNSRQFEGQVRLSVMAGDFCVVTNMSGEAQLPAADTQLGGCILLSEFHGAEPTVLMAERLEPVVREAALLSQGDIQVVIQPMSEPIQSYPPMTPTTNAGLWNQAANANNRVLVSVEPGRPQTARE